MFVFCCVVNVSKCIGLLGFIIVCIGCVVCFGVIGIGEDCWIFNFLVNIFLIFCVLLEEVLNVCRLVGGSVCWGRIGIREGEVWFKCCLRVCCVLSCDNFFIDIIFCWFCVDLLLELLVWVCGLDVVYIVFCCWFVVEIALFRGRRGEVCKEDNRGGFINFWRSVGVCDGFWLVMIIGDG